MATLKLNATSTLDTLVAANTTGLVEIKDSTDIKTYLVSNNRFEVDGVYTIDPEKVKIIMDASCPSLEFQIMSGGTLNYGSPSILNGITRYTEELGIWISGSTNSRRHGLPEEASFRVRSGGTLNWLGGKISLGSTFISDTGSIVTINQGIIDLGRRTPLPITAPLYFKNSQLNIDGLTLINGKLFALNAGIDFSNQKNLTLLHAQDGIFSTTNQTWINYAPRGCDYDAIACYNAQIRLPNCEVGSAVHVTAYNSSPAAANQGVVFVEKDIKVTLRDTDKANIPNANIYVPDYDNGKRLNRNGVNSLASTPTRIVTSATGVAEARITTLVFNRAGWGTGKDDPALQAAATDRRSKNNDTTDTYDIFFFAYGMQPKRLEYQLKGLNVLNISEELSKDDTVTHTRAVATALTAISSPDDAHSRFSLWRETNAINISDFSWSTVDSSWTITGKDLTLDSNATEVITVTPTRVTIKSSTFVGDIMLDADKTITLANGATIAGAYIDSTRNAAVDVIGIDLTPAGNHLYVSTDAGTTYTEMLTTTYSYLTHASNRVVFKFEKGTDNEGLPLTTSDDYALSGTGLDNEFKSFVNDTGVLISNQTATLQTAIDNQTSTLNTAISTDIENQTTSLNTVLDEIKTLVENSSGGSGNSTPASFVKPGS